MGRRPISAATFTFFVAIVDKELENKGFCIKLSVFITKISLYKFIFKGSFPLFLNEIFTTRKMHLQYYFHVILSYSFF